MVRGLITMNDHEKIASLVVDKLKLENRSERDEVFMKKLAAMLIEHRAPCHDLSKEQVDSLKEVLKKYKRLERGLFWVIVTVSGLMIKKIIDWAGVNLHWGS